MEWFALLPVSIGLGILVYFAWQKQKLKRERAESYERRYGRLLESLDILTKKVNYLSQSSSSVKEPKVLDYYESTLRILDTLLQTVKKISIKGEDSTVLGSAFYLVKDCNARTDRLKEAFDFCYKGMQVDLDKLYNRPKDPELTGCYFCSRPYVKETFSKTKVKIDGKTVKALCCEICRAELEANKKVKVLHLIKDGKTLHWSKVSDYVASEDYWKINDSKEQKQQTKLTLIVSRKESTSATNEISID